MSEIKDGGAAFPNGFSAVANERSGMTMRDYFAAKALEGLIAAFSDNPMREMVISKASKEGIHPKDGVARAAYEYADAMLRARSQS
jgi:hypothetical protein